MALIETMNLYQQYDGRQVLKNVNLSVDRAEVFTLVGPTGAGKTTLIRILDLVEAPYSGQLLFDGIDVLSQGTHQLETRRRMSYVQQRPVIFTMNVFDNVACGLKWRRMESGLIKRKTESALELVGMADYRNQHARTLSGGETQRIAIARALVTEPEVLFLDEPTANMDPNSVAKIEGILNNIIKEEKITIVMTTHNMAQAQRMSSRLGVIIDGQLMQTGDWHEVFSTPTTSDIAHFVGVENIIDGEIISAQGELVTIKVNGMVIEAISDFPVGEKVSVCIRPEDITVSTTRTSTSARNSFAGTIKNIVSFGTLTRVTIDCGFTLIVLVTTRSAGELNFVKGKEVFTSFKATAIHVIKRQGSV